MTLLKAIMLAIQYIPGITPGLIYMHIIKVSVFVLTSADIHTHIDCLSVGDSLSRNITAIHTRRLRVVSTTQFNAPTTTNFVKTGKGSLHGITIREVPVSPLGESRCSMS